MAKYSYEFKEKVVQAYLNGEGGYGSLAKKYNMQTPRNIEVWVRAYRECVQDKIKITLFNLSFLW